MESRALALAFGDHLRDARLCVGDASREFGDVPVGVASRGLERVDATIRLASFLRGDGRGARRLLRRAFGGGDSRGVFRDGRVSRGVLRDDSENRRRGDDGRRRRRDAERLDSSRDDAFLRARRRLPRRHRRLPRRHRRLRSRRAFRRVRGARLRVGFAAFGRLRRAFETVHDALRAFHLRLGDGERRSRRPRLRLGAIRARERVRRDAFSNHRGRILVPRGGTRRGIRQ